MLALQKYKQYIQEQGELESTVAEGWGYKINAKAHVPTVTKPQQKIKVSNIEPMRRVMELEPSAKLLQIEEELLMLENQKKLNKLTQQAIAAFQRGELTQNNESAAIKMMNQCIEDYNFLLEHRHIIEKNSEKARKILGIKKTRVQVLNEEIQSLRQQLPNSTFSQMISINKNIADLYRQYEKNMLTSKETTIASSIRGTSREKSRRRGSSLTKSITLLNTIKLSPDLRTEKKYSIKSSDINISRRGQKRDKTIVEMKDFVVLHQLKELQESSSGNSVEFERNNNANWIEADNIKNQPRSVFIRKGRVKLQKKCSLPQTRHRLQTVTEQCSSKEQKDRINTTMTQIFIPQDVLDKGQKLDEYLRQYEDVREVWKTRIDENRQKNRMNCLRIQPKTKRFKRNLKETKKIENLQQEQEEVQKKQRAKVGLPCRIQEVRKKMLVKEIILSNILKKKQNKDKRVPGTQIIQEYNPKKEDKIILGNKTRRASVNDRKTVYGTSAFGKHKSQQRDAPQWLTVDPDSDEIYWSMCKNEKMNLLLKNHKKI